MHLHDAVRISKDAYARTLYEFQRNRAVGESLVINAAETVRHLEQQVAAGVKVDREFEIEARARLLGAQKAERVQFERDLRDSTEWLNRERAKYGLPPEEPLSIVRTFSLKTGHLK